ncbi:hypothetical protein [Oleidesulfovibrio sp.]|uniref:hypothetical protein n=1 Tax=Oleidesulfovibrio sp. TaxID=2909707 RepID=UPI003A83A8DD
MPVTFYIGLFGERINNFLARRIILQNYCLSVLLPALQSGMSRDVWQVFFLTTAARWTTEGCFTGVLWLLRHAAYSGIFILSAWTGFYEQG